MKRPESLTIRRVLLLSVLALMVTSIYLIRVEHKMRDFEVYLRAGIRARAAEPLYRATDGHYQFKYLPAFAVAAVPLGLAPERLVRAVWFSASLALLAVLLRTSADILPVRRRSRATLIGLTFVLLAKFYAHELELGQVNILMATLVVLAAQQIHSGREWTAGLLVAAAIVVKPYAVLLVPYFLARRQLPAIVAAVAGLMAALVLPSLVYGFERNLQLTVDWWSTVRDTTAPNLADFNNVSALAVCTRWLGPGSAAETWATTTVVALLATVAIVFVRRGSIAFPEGLEVALLLTIMPIVSPQGWDYVFLISTLAVMYLVNYVDVLPRLLRPAVVAALIVIGFTIFDLVGRTAYRALMQSSVITLSYFVIIGGLVALRLRRVA